MITWDFGKEITINLQDALYTPASQSLIWGGRFNLGKIKIFGIFNPCIYNDENPSFTIEEETPGDFIKLDNFVPSIIN